MHFFLRSLASCLLCVLLWMHVPVTFADNVAMPSITLSPGDTVEIGTDTQAKSPQYSWVLTKDRQFISAQRTPFFRMRVTEPGQYLLDVNIQDAEHAITEYRAFTILVQDAPAPLPPLPPADSNTTPLLAILSTNPPISSGLIHLPKEGGFVKIDPLASRGKIARYDIDLNLALDSNGDGNPTNDRDADQTIFSLSGTPLYYYAIPSSTSRSFAVSVSGNGSFPPSTVQAAIAFSGLLPNEPSLPSVVSSSQSTQNPGSPIVVESLGASHRFSLLLPQELKQKQLLSEWDFGDHTKSLLLRPEHTYSASGVYPVRVLLRDITNGEVLFSFTDSISIQILSAETSSSSSIRSSSVSSSSAQSSQSASWFAGVSFASLFSVLLIVFFLLAIGIALFLILQFIKQKMGQKLADTLETIEQKIAPTSKEAILENVEPIKLAKPTAPSKTISSSQPPTQSEDVQADFTTTTRTNETPLAQSGPVPDWLKKTPSPSSSTPPSRPSPEKKNTLPPPPIFGKDAPTPPSQAPVSPSPSASMPPSPTPAPKSSTATVKPSSPQKTEQKQVKTPESSLKKEERLSSVSPTPVLQNTKKEMPPVAQEKPIASSQNTIKQTPSPTKADAVPASTQKTSLPLPPPLPSTTRANPPLKEVLAPQPLQTPTSDVPASSLPPTPSVTPSSATTGSVIPPRSSVDTTSSAPPVSSNDTTGSVPSSQSNIPRTTPASISSSGKAESSPVLTPSNPPRTDVISQEQQSVSPVQSSRNVSNPPSSSAPAIDTTNKTASPLTSSDAPAQEKPLASLQESPTPSNDLPPTMPTNNTSNVKPPKTPSFGFTDVPLGKVEPPSPILPPDDQPVAFLRMEDTTS